VKKQVYFPRNINKAHLPLISAMGLERGDDKFESHPPWSHYRQGKKWVRRQFCRHETFSLVASESYRSHIVEHTKWEDYVKVTFWLSGKHTVVLDGYGQHDHDGPEGFIIAGPRGMIKTDIVNSDTHAAGVGLCLKPEFFATQMGLLPDELPGPFGELAVRNEQPFVFYRFPLTPDLVAAAHAILAAPFTVRRQSLYAHAKATELMCLLLHQVQTSAAVKTRAMTPRQHILLCEARVLLTERYAEPLSLGDIAKEVGLNRVTLASGFRELFGATVFDFLQKTRMERAIQLLQDRTQSVAQVAEAVGYNHLCNFSTAFRAYFGINPQKARASSR
jgi:AraC-like DNA-binding protein